MAERDRLLVVTHPILGPIPRDEVERAIPPARRRGGWDVEEIAPVRVALGELGTLDWASALAEQERLFDQRLRPELMTRGRLAYFGFAPIPLAVHLGYRLERTRTIDVYQRHHRREDWRWAPPSDAALLTMRATEWPERASLASGPVVMRLSVSHRVEPQHCAEIVPGALADVEIALAEPHEDAILGEAMLTELAGAFARGLARLHGLFPNTTEIHLFMAVPVGLAFRVGMEINPTIYPSVVTYQFWAKAKPRYRPAIVLSDRLTVGSGLAGEDRPLIDLDEILALRRAAIEGGIVDRRQTLMTGVDGRLVASIPTAARPGDQVLHDLHALSRAGGGGHLRSWLRVAAEICRDKGPASVFAATLVKLGER